MSCGKECRFCPHADPNRTQNGKIRCKRFSQWVDPHSLCDEYADKSLSHMRATLEEVIDSIRPNCGAKMEGTG